MYQNKFYRKYKKDIHSQNGEDGIVEELFKRLNIKDGWVCEFGAWDGKHLSNTFHLVENGFNAVYIESDPEKYKDLLKTVEKHHNIVPINAFVDYGKGENILDNLLNRTQIPVDFDLLSIDVDSFDYQIWDSVKVYKPKVVIVEINSSVDVTNDYHIHTPGLYGGTGYKPMLNLGVSKGYTFVLHTGNMIFVRNDLFDQLNFNYSNPLENFRDFWIRHKRKKNQTNNKIKLEIRDQVKEVAEKKLKNAKLKKIEEDVNMLINYTTHDFISGYGIARQKNVISNLLNVVKEQNDRINVLEDNIIKSKEKI